MSQLQTLTDSLCELLKQIELTDIKLIIGGGFGIYLKMERVRNIGVRTLIEPEFWPEARSTNDLDLFLRPELLANSVKLKPLADAISDLGYKSVPGSENYQFVKFVEGSTAAKSKIDILTGPKDSFSGTAVRVDDRRVRPKPSVGLHAHPVNEAPTLEKDLVPVTVAGKIRSGERWSGEVFLPHPFTFTMMKLFAFRDRLIRDADQEKARYHALDVYSILATTTEEEWGQALTLRKEFQRHSFVTEAGQIVQEHFAQAAQLGLLRLQESRYYGEEFKLAGLSSALLESFAA
ncbi:MAG TPA: hypothetical protein VF020_13290 [Chthoniobacterales bacterium]